MRRSTTPVTHSRRNSLRAKVAARRTRGSGRTAGVAAAGYFGWIEMQVRQAQPVQQSAAPAQTSLATQPPAPETAAPESKAPSAEVRLKEQTLTTSGPASSSKPSAAVVSETPGSRTAAPVAARPAENRQISYDSAQAPQPDPSASEPLLVKTAKAPGTTRKPYRRSRSRHRPQPASATGADTPL